MISREATIAAIEGLHARPASQFVAAAKESGLNVTIAKSDKSAVSAASILSVLGLGVKKGDVVTLSATGDHADEVLESLVRLLERVEQ